MWFWAVFGILVASAVVVAAFYDRRIRNRGYRLRKGGDIERNIAKGAGWNDPSGGGS